MDDWTPNAPRASKGVLLIVVAFALVVGFVVLTGYGFHRIGEGKDRFDAAQERKYAEILRAADERGRRLATLEIRYGITIDDAPYSTKDETWVIDGVERQCRVDDADLAPAEAQVLCEGEPLPEITSINPAGGAR